MFNSSLTIAVPLYNESETIDYMKERLIKAIEKIVDSTAAGDSFNSEILVGLLRKIPINDAINNGVNLAKKVIVGKGALVPSNV